MKKVGEFVGLFGVEVIWFFTDRNGVAEGPRVLVGPEGVGDSMDTTIAGWGALNEDNKVSMQQFQI